MAGAAQNDAVAAPVEEDEEELLPGMCLFVRYPARIPGRRWRERILGHYYTDTKWWAFDEDGSDTNLDLAMVEEIVKIPEDRTFPAGITRANSLCQENTDRIYTPEQRRELIADTEVRARMERRRMGVPPPRPAPPFFTDKQPTGLVAGAWGPHQRPRVPGDHCVVIAEATNVTGVRAGGTVVPLDGTEAGIGEYGIKLLADGRAVKIRILPDAQREAYKLELYKDVVSIGDDPRVLELQNLGGTGMRGRLFIEGAKECVEVAAKDWPVEGPRTMSWILKYYRRRGKEPTDHSTFWKQVTTKLDEGAYGVEEHFALSEIIRDAIEYDQLDVCNLASMERIGRRIQMIEYHWRAKADLKRVLETPDGKLDPLTKDLFAGNRSETGILLVAPEMLQYLKKETTEETDKAKAERKLREERAAALAAAKAGKKP